ncbi:hypothetical protein AZE42_13339, partial [Rhizopogon vesiculosus]
MAHTRKKHVPYQFPCGHPHCKRYFKTLGGRTRHRNSLHPILNLDSQASTQNIQAKAPQSDPNEDSEARNDDPESTNMYDDCNHEPDVDAEFVDAGKKLYRNYHHFLNARPCDANGNFLPPGSPPSPALSNKSPDNWTPYRNRLEFETAEYIFTRNQMSATQINQLLDLWATSLLRHGDQPPFADYRDLYKTIDSTPLGDVPWENFSIQYTGERPEDDVPPWMDERYE